MSDPTTLLLVEDNPGDADLVADLLADAIPPLEVIHVQQIRDALDRLRERSFDAILLDLSLPDATGLNGLRHIRTAAPEVPVVMLTGSADHALGAAAVRDGAQDYLVKGQADGEALARAIRYAVERQRSAGRERALAEESARRLAAEQGVRARDEFLSIVSHELRTPLASLKLGVDHLRLLVARGADTPAISARLESAARRVGRLTGLVDQILDVSRIESGGLALVRERVDLADVTRTILARLEGAAAAASCAIELDARETATGEWDRRAIEQVVASLLSNALKYGAGKPVVVQTAALAGMAMLRVSDRGIGIAPGDVARIFERFERAVSTRHYGGLGVGLYVARRLVEAHGGAIEVVSERDVGSTFTVRLPRVPAAA